ncbi:MAG TPA: FecR family protein [Nitrospira sp.]|nr:FecR family protein [Nitrospira sp.]
MMIQRHVLIAVVLIAVLNLAPVPSAVADNTPIGTATNAVGTLVIIRTDGVQQRLQGKGNIPLYEGDVLKTDASSQALINFSEGIEVALNEDTSFKLLSRWEKDRPTVRILRLKQGEVWAKTAGGPKRFEVETPVATASVKETEFNLKVQEDGQSILTVIEGVVQFGTPFGTCPIRTDTISYGVRGKKCTKPAPSDAKTAKSWTEAVRGGVK